MEHLFAKIVSISINSLLPIVLVILFRRLFRSGSKKCMLVLWAAIAVRLMIPVTIKMPIGLYSRTDPFRITSDPIFGAMGEAGQNLELRSGISLFDRVLKPLIIKNDRMLWQGDIHARLHQGSIAFLRVLCLLWLIGIAAMILGLVIQMIRLHRTARIHLEQADGTWLVDSIRTPFVYGLFRPKVILPGIQNETVQAFALRHEREHIRCGHHVLKILAFLILSVHWFNPLVWAAFGMFSHDLEVLCDERILRNLTKADRLRYAEALLFFTKGKRPAMVPQISGGGCKERITRVLEPRKRKRPVACIAIVIAMIIVFFSFSEMTEIHTVKSLPEGENLMWEGVRLSGRIVEKDGALLFQADDPNNRWVNNSLCLLRDRTEEASMPSGAFRPGDHIQVRFTNVVKTEPLTIDVREFVFVK